MSARHGEGESARVRTVGKGPQRVVASGVGVSLVLVRGRPAEGVGAQRTSDGAVLCCALRGGARLYGN